MLALFFNGEWKAALDIGERALANHPNDSELLGEYGDKLAMTGEWERGTDMMLDALDRNQGPRSFYSVALASCYYMLSDYATAVRWITEATADGNPIYHLVAAAVFGQIGDAERVQRHRAWIVANAAGFLTRINEQLSIRGMKTEDRMHFIDGLRKAGLPIPEAS
jgi:tetratricopeptide (TPR) repeat protein